MPPTVVSPPSEPAPFDQLPHMARAPMSLDERRALALLTDRMFGSGAADPVRLGRFTVRERLGSGGTGVVYRGWDPKLRRDVAIKVVRRDAEGHAGSTRSSRRLLREARLLARLDHPHVVKIFATGVEEGEGVAYVVMEFVEGATLQQWLDECRRPWAQILTRLRDAIDALEAAHHVGVIHRDFKPTNVLMGRDGRLRVVDFGGMGTPGFMAPEQIRGGPVDTRTDVYAVCEVARRAFEGRDVPRWLDRIIDGGRQDDPARRPQSMQELRRLLDAPGRRRVGFMAGGLLLGVVAFAGVVLLDAGGEGSSCPLPRALDDIPPASVRSEFIETQAEWTEAVRQICGADGPAADAVACLHTMRAKIRGTMSALAQTSDAAAAALVVDALPSPLACLDPSAPSDPSPLRLQYELLWAEMSATQKFGSWPEAGSAIAGRLRQLRQAALIADDAYVEGRTAMALGLIALQELRHDDARRLFEDSYAMALRADDDAVAFEAAQYMVQLQEYIGDDTQAGQLWLQRGRDVAKRVGTATARARIALLEAGVAKHRGDWGAAVAAYETAAGLLDEEASVITRVELHNGRGMAKLHTGDPQGALLDFEDALQLQSDIAQTDSTELGPTLNGLGIALRTLERFDEAETHLRRLQRIMERQQPGSPDIAAVRGNLAQLYADQERYEEAIAEFRAVRDVYETFAGPEHPQATRTSAAIASALYELGRHDEAKREAQRALRWDVPAPERAGVRLIVAATSRGEVRQQAIEAVLDDPAATEQQRSEAKGLR